MSNESNAPVAPIIPDLNRPEVVNRKTGDNFLDWDAYGTYVFAVRHWRFDPGKRNNPSWRAHVVVLSAATPEELGWELPTGMRIGWLRKPFRPKELLDGLVKFRASLGLAER